MLLKKISQKRGVAILQEPGTVSLHRCLWPCLWKRSSCRHEPQVSILSQCSGMRANTPSLLTGQTIGVWSQLQARPATSQPSDVHFETVASEAGVSNAGTGPCSALWGWREAGQLAMCLERVGSQGSSPKLFSEDCPSLRAQTRFSRRQVIRQGPHWVVVPECHLLWVPFLRIPLLSFPSFPSPIFFQGFILPGLVASSPEVSVHREPQVQAWHRVVRRPAPLGGRDTQLGLACHLFRAGFPHVTETRSGRKPFTPAVRVSCCWKPCTFFSRRREPRSVSRDACAWPHRRT